MGEDDEILFYHPLTGALQRSILAPLWPSGHTEGIADDGDTLWCIVYADLKQIDLFTGAVLSTIPNAAAGEPFGGTAIAVGSADTLYVAGSSGNWWEVEKATGTVVRSGNNGLLMRGLDRPKTRLGSFARGDVNDDGTVDISDAVFALGFFFTAGSDAPHCRRSLDVNDDAQLNVADPVFLLTTLFSSGVQPPPPYPDCGPDPTPDLLGCVEFETCP